MGSTVSAITVSARDQVLAPERRELARKSAE
jgi:hypothetical protein